MKGKGTELSATGGRLSAREAVKAKIERLRNEADGLEALLTVLDNIPNWTGAADEALWRLVIK